MSNQKLCVIFIETAVIIDFEAAGFSVPDDIREPSEEWLRQFDAWSNRIIQAIPGYVSGGPSVDYMGPPPEK